MIEEHIKTIWDAANRLHEEAKDMQPGSHREIAINLSKYITTDLKYMAYKLGVALS